MTILFLHSDGTKRVLNTRDHLNLAAIEALANDFRAVRWVVK